MTARSGRAGPWPAAARCRSRSATPAGRSPAMTTRRSAHAFVSRWTWRLNARRFGWRESDPQRPVDVLGERRRQALLELLERRGQVRVVLVGVADHQPGRQEDRHRLGERELQRRQEVVADDAPEPALGPDADADLLVDRLAGRDRRSATDMSTRRASSAGRMPPGCARSTCDRGGCRRATRSRLPWRSARPGSSRRPSVTARLMGRSGRPDGPVALGRDHRRPERRPAARPRRSRAHGR